jgi:hypothetical protein
VSSLSFIALDNLPLSYHLIQNKSTADISAERLNQNFFDIFLKKAADKIMFENNDSPPLKRGARGDLVVVGSLPPFSNPP